MSSPRSTATRASRRLTRVPLCDRCEDRPAEHQLAVQGSQGGFDVLACRECWPGLQAAVQTIGAAIQKCSCGRC